MQQSMQQPAPLPSSDSARDLVAGVPGAGWRVVAHMVGRGALCGVGGYAMGLRGDTLLKASVGAALAIEVFALTWFAVQQRGPNR